MAKQDEKQREVDALLDQLLERAESRKEVMGREGPMQELQKRIMERMLKGRADGPPGLGEARSRGPEPAADRRLDAGVGQPLRVANGEVLNPPVAVVNQGIRRGVLTLAQSLLEGIQGQVALQRTGNPPAHDPPGIGIDHEGHVGRSPAT